MISLWLTRGNSTSLREQLEAQLLLGILSGSIQTGERLPSVRALARKLRIHPNTVTAAYHALVEQGWLRARPGSGVFATSRQVSPNAGTIQTFASDCVARAERLGFSRQQFISALVQPGLGRGTSMLVIDPDRELARIIAAEIGEVREGPIAFADLKCLPEKIPSNIVPIVSARHVSTVAPLLDGLDYRTVKLRSVPELLSGLQPPRPDALVALVSRSKVLARWAQTLVSALGVSAEAVLYRNPSEPHWTAGLTACDLVAADLPSARELPANIRSFVVHLVSPSSLAELGSHDEP